MFLGHLETSERRGALLSGQIVSELGSNLMLSLMASEKKFVQNFLTSSFCHYSGRFGRKMKESKEKGLGHFSLYFGHFDRKTTESRGKKLHINFFRFRDFRFK